MQVVQGAVQGNGERRVQTMEIWHTTQCSFKGMLLSLALVVHQFVHGVRKDPAFC